MSIALILNISCATASTNLQANQIDSLALAGMGGSVTASQSLFELAPGQIGTVTINWETSDGAVGQVYVSTSGDMEKLFVQGARGSQAAEWIVAPNNYVFNLYAGTGHSALLDSKTVTAKAASSCSISADCVARQICFNKFCQTNFRTLEVYAGIYPSSSSKLGTYINEISHNFAGMESCCGLFQKSQVDALHSKGFKVMVHCNSNIECLAFAQEGADILAFDEWKLNFQNGVTMESMTGAEFNSKKAQYKTINPNIQVGIVEAYIPQYNSFYNEGAEPDFIGLEQYRDVRGNFISPYPPYSEFISQVASKFPRAKIHIWSNEVNAVELYQNKADLLIYFNIDNNCCSMALPLPLSAVENELTNVYGNTGCTPKTCSSLGYSCGNANNGCGGSLSCGACSAGQKCFNNKCTSNCTPKTCVGSGYHCGIASDGCGNTLNCGSCSSGQNISNNKLCEPNLVLGCKVCNFLGSMWIDDNSKCFSGQVCQKGQCIENPHGNMGSIYSPESCKVNQTCAFTIRDCSNGILIIKNLQGQPIDFRKLIMEDDIPLTFFSYYPYTRSFIPSEVGLVGAIELCFDNIPRAERKELKIIS